MKNILLIGGSSGIGYELTKKLESDNNVFVSTRNPDKFTGSNITSNKLDLDEDYNTDWLPESIHGFIYLPGTINLRPFKGLKPSTFIEDFNINLLGCVKILQAVLPKLQSSDNASVVLFSTVAVKLGMPFHSSVSASKGAIEGLTRSLAAEFAPKIRVNAVAPSILNTPMSEKFLKFTKSVGNDLSTPNPIYNFPGLKSGDRWCLCALRWKEAYDAGVAPFIIPEATHKKALDYIELSSLLEMSYIEYVD